MSKMQNELKNDPLMPLRHSVEHIMQLVVEKLLGAKKVMGPAIETGFYGDFDGKITDEDLTKIEEEMQNIIKKDLPIKTSEISYEEAKELFKDNKFKLEIIEEIKDKGEKIGVCEIGSKGDQYYDIDICGGPHIESTGKVNPKAIKLLSIAGAYWRGDSTKEMLTRIYGTAFNSEEELNAYLEKLEDAKRRDHRKLGKDLELFFIDDMVGKGLIMWLPKGHIVKEQIENLAKKMEHDAGYQRVTTPHIAKEELYLTSGHLPYYKESMYPAMEMDDGTYYMKAMNCPHHHRIFLHKPRSYREMPLRIAEYGVCYRNELSGTLAGLLRVRSLAMNDAHIYCRKSQIKEEFKNVMKLTMDYFKIFGLNDYWFRLSKWDPSHLEKYVNEPDNWEYSQQVIRETLEEMKVPYYEAEDEAAFYGPKVDVQFKSVIGREETMSTIQLDFVAKERFKLNYIDESGKENNEVFVIHRAPLSTHERFMAFLIEHFAGAFPTWMSPVQVSIIPIGENHVEYAQKVAKKMEESGLRVTLDDKSETMQNKIREAQHQKIPYMLIIGDREVQSEEASVRLRTGENKGSLKIDEIIGKIKEIELTKGVELW